MLIIENGSSNPNAKAFASVEQFRKYWNGRWGGEAYSDAGDCDNDRVASALWAAAEYMDTLQWVGCRSTHEQALCWPRIVSEPHDWRSVSGKYHTNLHGWLGHSSRWCVSACEIPEQIVEANILLARDVLDGFIDPSGRLKPTVVTGVSSEAGSLAFSRPQALSNQGGMQVRSRDPIQSVRRLVSPWLKIRAPHARLYRG